MERTGWARGQAEGRAFSKQLGLFFLLLGGFLAYWSLQGLGEFGAARRAREATIAACDGFGAALAGSVVMLVGGGVLLLDHRQRFGGALIFILLALIAGPIGGLVRTGLWMHQKLRAAGYEHCATSHGGRSSFRESWRGGCAAVAPAGPRT